MDGRAGHLPPKKSEFICAFFLGGICLIFKSERTYLEEFIPRIEPYLHCMLSAEGVSAMTMCQSCMSASFEWRCSDCFPALVLCKKCCKRSHQRLPFHRVQRWTGKYFMPSRLREVGVSLHLGHSGDSCPSSPNQSVRNQAFYSFYPDLNITTIDER